jgi:CRP-like cAMP-binding protein
VIEVVTEALHGSPIENVASEPKPSVVCMDFAKDGRDSVAVYAVRYWLTDLAVDDPTNSRVRARIYAALQRAGIPLAIPATTNLIEVHDKARNADHLERKITAHLDALGHVPLFHDLDANELRTLAEGMSHVMYTAGETITKQGAVAHWLYVMTGGMAEVRTHAAGDAVPSHTVATLGAPNFFGEMGLMTGAPRSADVIAVSDVECFRLGKTTFERVLAARPEIAHSLADTLAHRHVGLVAVREQLDEETRATRQAHERERILDGIKSFFGL